MAAAELEAAKNSWQLASADVPDARPRLHVGRVCAGGGIGLGPAAELEAAKNSWQVAVTILDSGGNLVMFHKLDDTQLASIGVSEGKANTALRFKRPSKALDDVIAAGGAGLRLLAVKDITPLEGGLPVILDGTIIGAIGVSGALSSQDAQVARAGAAAVVK